MAAAATAMDVAGCGAQLPTRMQHTGVTRTAFGGNNLVELMAGVPIMLATTQQSGGQAMRPSTLLSVRSGKSWQHLRHNTTRILPAGGGRAVGQMQGRQRLLLRRRVSGRSRAPPACQHPRGAGDSELWVEGWQCGGAPSHTLSQYSLFSCYVGGQPVCRPGRQPGRIRGGIPGSNHVGQPGRQSGGVLGSPPARQPAGSSLFCSFRRAAHAPT